MESRGGADLSGAGQRGLRPSGLADVKRIDPDRLGDVLELGLAEIVDRDIEPALHLPIGVLGKADLAGLAIAFQPRGDVDAVAHEIAVDSPRRRRPDESRCGIRCACRCDARVALDHGVLHFDCAAHRVDHAAELDDAAVAGALDDPSAMHGDRRVNQIAAERPQPRQRSIFVRAGEPAIADHIGETKIAASFRVSDKGRPHGPCRIAQERLEPRSPPKAKKKPEARRRLLDLTRRGQDSAALSAQQTAGIDV